MRNVPFTLWTGFMALIGQRRRAHWIAVRHWLRWMREYQHPTRCSWCDRGTRYGNPALPTSHGICRHCRVNHFRAYASRPAQTALAS